MTELLFWETTIGKTPVSFAIDLEAALKFGVSGETHSTKLWTGVYDFQIHFICLVFTFTLYPRGCK
jgi:hypothetical protein